MSYIKTFEEFSKENLSEKIYTVIITDPTTMYLDKPVKVKVRANSEDEAIEKAQQENIEDNDGDTTEVDTYNWDVA